MLHRYLKKDECHRVFVLAISKMVELMPQTCISTWYVGKYLFVVITARFLSQKNNELIMKVRLI